MGKFVRIAGLVTGLLLAEIATAADDVVQAKGTPAQLLVALPEDCNTPDGMCLQPDNSIILSVPNFNDEKSPPLLMRITPENKAEVFYKFPTPYPGYDAPINRIAPMGISRAPVGRSVPGRHAVHEGQESEVAHVAAGGQGRQGGQDGPGGQGLQRGQRHGRPRRLRLHHRVGPGRRLQPHDEQRRAAVQAGRGERDAQDAAARTIRTSSPRSRATRRTGRSAPTASPSTARATCSWACSAKARCTRSSSTPRATSSPTSCSPRPPS